MKTLNTKWSIGSATGTIFKDDHPTGSEVKVFNLNHGSPRELVDQANLVPDLIAEIQRTKEVIQSILTKAAQCDYVDAHGLGLAQLKERNVYLGRIIAKATT